MKENIDRFDYVKKMINGFKKLHFYTGCSAKIVFFPQNVVIFPNSASSVAIDLPSSGPA